MSKYVQLMNTDQQIVCVNIDKVLYAVSYPHYLKLVFGDNADIHVKLSMNEFYDLATGKP